jgi:hypothetical protein
MVAEMAIVWTKALNDQQDDRGHPGDEEQEREQHGQLAEHVLNPRERLRQINLQRIGAPIRGDQPGAGVDGDEEDETRLLRDEIAEHLGRRRKERRLRNVGGRVHLHRADEKRRPSEQEQAEKRTLLQHRPDAGRRDDRPRAPVRGAFAAISPVALVVNRHDYSPTA